jgi:hypothetical protein
MTATLGAVTDRFLPLFDPAVEEPPSSAVEIYFETPTSLGLLYTFSQRFDQPRLVGAVREAHEAGIAAALDAIADVALLKVGEHIEIPGKPSMGRYLPGRLSLTRVSHTYTGDPGDIARFHDHVFIGRTGIADHDGERWPLATEDLRRGLRTFAVCHIGGIHVSLRESIGARWSEERTWMGFQELTYPDLGQYVADFPRQYCRYGLSSPARWNVVDIIERL